MNKVPIWLIFVQFAYAFFKTGKEDNCIHLIM